MDPLCRIESYGDELLDIEPKASQLIEKIGWRKFFGSFNGFNSELVLRFSLSLKDNVVQIGDVTLILAEGFIAKAT